jgi:hypothetical protein
MGIYAKLRVPEVWCWDGVTRRVFLLGPDGQYTQSTTSRAFPFLPLEVFSQFLQADPATSETQLVREFRQWVREQMAHAAAGSRWKWTRVKRGDRRDRTLCPRP